MYKFGLVIFLVCGLCACTVSNDKLVNSDDFDYSNFSDENQEKAFDKKILKEIKEFRQSPKAYLNKQLIKEGGKSANYFSAEDIQSRDFVEIKDKQRKAFIGDRPLAPIEAGDQVRSLVDNPSGVISSLSFMDLKDYQSASLDTTPWSDNYWPIYQGQLGSRYGIGKFLNMGSDWANYINTVMEPGRTIVEVWNSRNSSNIDLLSPSEKYDLLLGIDDIEEDDAFWQYNVSWSEGGWPKGYLTPGQWAEGQAYYNRNGKVESWMGICHGWAAAAYTMERPEESVEVLAADGETKVKFYPADIKALSSYVWAQNRTATGFSGGRCNEKDPGYDDNGRILSQKCFDTNPGTWHMAVVHQIAKNKRSFVIDATYDYEVWNQPVYSYKYKYFDTVNDNRSYDWKEVRRSVDDLEFSSNDVFKKYRSAAAKYVVGVAMDLTYVVETAPFQFDYDSEKRDLTKTVTYIYDLELDAEGNILGGEWYNNNHPDFMWNIPERAVTQKQYHSGYDQRLSGTTWNSETEPLPESWKQVAKQAAKQDTLPLSSIVDELIRRSKN